MIKFTELAEQAKFIADWHGADWSSALCQDKDGNKAHEIICESRGESVISTGSSSNEASWLCDYLELCSPENIIAIAKYVEELERRLNATAQPVSDGCKLVPIEPTEEMLIAGFDSEPDEGFSEEAEWEKYQAMSGCQQAKHRARLCWNAMLAAATGGQDER